MIRSTRSFVQHGGGSVLGWACIAANGTGHRAILSFHIQPNSTVHMDNDLKHTEKARQDSLIGIEIEYSSMVK